MEGERKTTVLDYTRMWRKTAPLCDQSAAGSFFLTHVFTSGAEVWSVAFKDTQYINYTWAQKAAVTELMYKCAYLHVSPPNRAATRRAAS